MSGGSLPDERHTLEEDSDAEVGLDWMERCKEMEATIERQRQEQERVHAMLERLADEMDATDCHRWAATLRRRWAALSVGEGDEGLFRLPEGADKARFEFPGAAGG